MAEYSPGLEGVIAGKSTICTVGSRGDSLHYRGYCVEDMCEKQVAWDEMAYMLIHDHRASASELAEWRRGIMAGRLLPEAVRRMLETLPAETHPMDVLRTGWSMLGNFYEEEETPQVEVIGHLIGSGPSIICWWHNSHRGVKAPLDYPHPDQGGFFLYALRGGKMPDDMERDLMNTSMILYTEHGFNASTFAARVATSTLTDMWSAVVAAVGTLKGPLHGGANEAAMELILKFNDPEEAERSIMDMLKKKEKIMGFGHRVYKVRDPRSDIIKEWTEKLSAMHPHKPYLAIAERIDQVMAREKKLFPNADFYHAPAYYLLGIPIPLFTPIFAFARVAGWIAHILEQRVGNRIMRPTEEYVGPGHREW